MRSLRRRSRQFLRRPILRLVREIPRASKPLTAVVSTLVLLSGLLPNAFILASGAVVGSVPGAVRGGFESDAGRRLVAALIAVAVIFVAQQAIVPLREAVMSILATRVNASVSDRLLRATLGAPGVALLESPETLDDISTAQGVGPGAIGPGLGVRGVVMLAELRLAAILSAALLAGFSWWLAAVLLIFRFVVRRRVWKVMERSMDAQVAATEGVREARYLRDLALRIDAAKETRVFGLGGWLVDRFTGSWLSSMEGVWRERRRGDRQVALGAVAVAVADTLAFVMLGLAAGRGDISVGEVTVYAQAIFGIATIGQMRSEDLMIQYGSAALPAVDRVEQAASAGSRESRGPVSRDVARRPREMIRFRGVSFRYPGTAANIFDGLDLEIPAGRSLAIVGVNGAGKTTLVKLLARLYDPDQGEMTVDGIDVRQFDAAAWQGQVAAIFQDFVRYELTARDNVGFGAIERVDDATALRRAADRAGALPIVEGLPHGWDTVLARQYEMGSDLSGGQWQRIALARALFAVEGGAKVLVLDEPTANLDVRAEAELYDRFLDLTAGLTTVVISHRFSTVRRADRIVVLEHGRVVEEGNHEELLERDGRYATMFRLQAARFGDEDTALA